MLSRLFRRPPKPRRVTVADKSRARCGQSARPPYSRSRFEVWQDARPAVECSNGTPLATASSVTAHTDANGKTYTGKWKDGERVP